MEPYVLCAMSVVFSKLELDIMSEIIPSLRYLNDQDNKHLTYPVITDISHGAGSRARPPTEILKYLQFCFQIRNKTKLGDFVWQHDYIL